MKSFEDSRLLANLMVQTGESSGTRTVALLTTMDEPLGRFAGNWLEVWECVEILQGTLNPLSADLITLSTILAGWMLHIGGKTPTPEAGAKLADDLLSSGAAYKSWLCMVEAQGGDTAIFTNPAAFHKPTATRVLTATQPGYFASMDTTQAGWAIQRLGAGRLVPGGPVSAHAGIEMHVKLGDRITTNQPLITLYSEDESLVAEPFQMLHDAIQISPSPARLNPLIREVITAKP